MIFWRFWDDTSVSLCKVPFATNSGQACEFSLRLDRLWMKQMGLVRASRYFCPRPLQYHRGRVGLLCNAQPVARNPAGLWLTEYLSGWTWPGMWVTHKNCMLWIYSKSTNFFLAMRQNRTSLCRGMCTPTSWQLNSRPMYLGTKLWPIFGLGLYFW